MDARKIILRLKTIKLLFDIVLWLLITLIALFIVISVLNVGNKGGGVSGWALIKQKTEPIILSGDIKSEVPGVELSLMPEGVKVSYEVFSQQHKTLFVACKVLYLFTLNLGMFFLVFVLFQIRNIIKSVYLGVKSENSNISHHVFSRKNILRLKYIAYGFLIIPFVELLNYFADKYFLTRYVNIKGLTILPTDGIGNISWEYILVGLLFTVMIEVFKKGLHLQEENDLTV